jgi:iron complex outermembrane receptor protein
LTFAGLVFSNPPFSGYGTFLLDAFQHTKSKSAYAQGTARLLPKTEFTVGARYTDEDQKSESEVFGSPIPDVKRGFKKWTWRLAADHAFTDDIHAYVSYNRGVKGGGFDLLSPFSGGYDPEVLDAYELGIKTKLLDNRLRLNAALFRYDYKNIQVQVIPAGTGGIVATTNAAEARVKGLDVDFEFRPMNDFGLSGGFAIVDGKYLDFKDTVAYPASPLDGPPTLIDASGNRTVRTPRFTGNLTADYRVQSSVGEFPLSVTISRNSGFFFGSDNRLKQPAFTMINASAGWTSDDERYGLTLWGRNLTDKHTLTQGVPSGFGDLTAPAAPRTYGVTLRTKLGG